MFQDKTDLYTAITIGVVLLCLAAAAISQPHFEAKTFNKYRKDGTPPATYWDAVWANLRVDTD